MFGSERFHEHVPRKVEENLLFRKALINECDDSKKSRAYVYEACRRDCLFWINSFAFQYNPNKFGGEVGPFCTYPFQDVLVHELLDRIARRKDLLVEKSREMGLSWLVLMVFDWIARFYPAKDFLVISHSEEAVYKAGNPNTLFAKLLFLDRHLPDWFPRVKKRKMSLDYEHTNSHIVGAANTVRAGVGARAAAILLDEFAKQPNASSILSDTADTSKCRIVVSTHYGAGTEFYRLASNPLVEKVVCHWTEHPEKSAGAYRYDPHSRRIEFLDADYPYKTDYPYLREPLPAGGARPGVRSPWYDEECNRQGRSSRDIAMHLDIDPQGSGHQVFDALVITDLRRDYARDPDWEGDVEYDPDSGEFVGLLRQTNGPLQLWFDPGEGNCPKWNADAPLYYAAGGDLGLGMNVTPSCFAFADSLGRKVGQYTVRTVDPKALAPRIVALCKFFSSHTGRPAKLGWEANGPGQTFGRAIIDLGYTEIYWRKKRVGYAFTEEDTDCPGWNSSPSLKKLLIEDYSWALKNRVYLNPSDEALRECLNFEYTESGVEHALEKQKDRPAETGVNHGDMVIADAICSMLVGPLLQSERVKERKKDAAPVGSILHRRLVRSNRTREGELEWA